MSASFRPVDGPELDYAYLAEYAKVDGGKLTVVDASFTHVTGTTLPGVFSFAVAGRVRVPAGFREIVLNFEFANPNRQTVLKFDAPLSADPAERPYKDRVGRLFALNLGLPIAEPGLCVVTIGIDDQEVRTLAFEVEPAPQAGP